MSCWYNFQQESKYICDEYVDEGHFLEDFLPIPPESVIETPLYLCGSRWVQVECTLIVKEFFLYTNL